MLRDCPHLGADPLTVCPACRMVVPPPAAVKPTRTRTAKPTKTKPAVDTMPVEAFEPIAFVVYGEPVTQGSMRSLGRGRMAHVNGPELTAWRTLIATEARTAGVRPVGDHAPIRVDATFYLPRPASVKRDYPTGRKDTDKLMRALGDALTGVAYVDDVQVCDWNVSKRYADDTHPPGVLVIITLLGDEHLATPPTVSA